MRQSDQFNTGFCALIGVNLTGVADGGEFGYRFLMVFHCFHAQVLDGCCRQAATFSNALQAL